MSTSGYRQIDHTADLALELWAPTEEALLLVAARALVDMLTDAVDGNGRAARPASTATRRIEIDAVDRDDRLVQWLNEVLVAALVDGFLLADADIALYDNRGQSRLVARARGEAGSADKIVTELKSATYHDLELACTDQGWHARVVIDV